MWSCAWLASTGMGDDAGGGLGEGCTADDDFDGLGEGCSADNDFALPAGMSIHISCLTEFPEYIALICRGELVRYFREQR